MDQQRADAGFVRRSLCLYAVTDPDLNKKQGRFVAAYARVSVQACVPSFIRCVICICQCFKSQASALCILGHMCCVSVRTYPHLSVSMCGLLCLCCGMPLLRTHVFVSFVWTTVLWFAYLCVPTFHVSVSMCGLLCLCLCNALITYSCVCELCVDYCVMCCISVRTYPHVLKYVWTTVFVFVSLRAFVFFCFILLVLCAPCNLLCGHKSEWVCFIFYTVPVSHRLCFQLKVYTST